MQQQNQGQKPPFPQSVAGVDGGRTVLPRPRTAVDYVAERLEATPTWGIQLSEMKVTTRSKTRILHM